jgi:hypothetical protein
MSRTAPVSDPRETIEDRGFTPTNIAPLAATATYVDPTEATSGRGFTPTNIAPLAAKTSAIPKPKKAEVSFGEAFSAARKAEKTAGKKSGTSTFEYKGKSYTTKTAEEAAPKPAAKSVVARSNEKSTRLDSSNPNTSTNITNHLSNVEKESLKANPALAGHYTATANRRANEAASGDTSNTDSANEASDNKIVCTAMNNSYGFGSYRQAIWLSYSKDHLTKEHELGYHTLFLPLVDLAYNKNNKFVRKALEHIARHRTADLRASMQNKKRDTLGRVYRSILEPLVYTVGKFRTITGI